MFCVFAPREFYVLVLPFNGTGRIRRQFETNGALNGNFFVRLV